MVQNSASKLKPVESDFIRDIPLLAGLTDEEKNTLLKEGRICSFGRRQTIFRQGDPLNNFYIICSGTVQLCRETPDGREITLDILSAGHFACLTEIFELSNVYMLNAVAVNDVSLVSLPKAWLLETAKKNGVFALNLLSAISRQSRTTEVNAEHQATMSAPQLLACYLQHLCADNNFNPRGFDLPVSKSLIASRLGMEIETLSRALPVLQKYGISVRGKQVIFRDFPSVEENVCGHCSVMETCRARKIVRQTADDAARLSKENFKLV